MFSWSVPSPYLHLDPVVSVAQVLQVGGGVGLDGGEVMLQHVDDFRQLGVTPRKLPEGNRTEKRSTRRRPSVLLVQDEVSPSIIRTKCPMKKLMKALPALTWGPYGCSLWTGSAWPPGPPVQSAGGRKRARQRPCRCLRTALQCSVRSCFFGTAACCSGWWSEGGSPYLRNQDSQDMNLNHDGTGGK